MPMQGFTPQVRDWFLRSFEGPTEAQSQAWPAIARGENVLLSAPTGSGKTLAAFLWALDRLVAEPGEGTRLVYVSPLKALSYDIAGPGVPRQHEVADRRRGARGRANQARRTPGADDGATRAPGRGPDPAHRS